MQPAAWTTGPDGAAVLQTATEALVSLGYTLSPDATGWGGRAEVGSKAARVFAGGFARRMIVDYAVRQGAHPGTTQLVITPASSGWSGGAIGASKAQQEMGSIAAAVHGVLAARGLLAPDPQAPGPLHQ